MIRSEFYKAIRDKLLADIPGLTVDVDRGQMDNAKADYPIPVPLALVAFSAIRWEVYSEGVECGTLTIDISYYKAICSATFSGAEAEAETLELLDSPDEIYRSLRYFEPPGANAFYRTAEREIRSHGRLIGYRVTFEAHGFEN